MSYRNLAALCMAGVLLAELPAWVSTIEVRTKLEEIFFTGLLRRPPKETRPLLDAQIRQAPADARLYYLRAREAEAQVDFAAAEADWARFVETSTDKAAAWREKADFHARRVEPQKRIAALLEAAKPAASGLEQYREARKQASWRALEQALATARDHRLPATPIWTAWEARYPNEPATYRMIADDHMAAKRWDSAESAIGRFARAFPGDESGELALRAGLERRRGNAGAALALYERAYKPDWPDTLLREYLALSPTLSDATRRFHKHRLAGNLAAAKRELKDFAGEPLLLARFHEQVDSFQQAAVIYQRLAPGNEQANAALIELLIAQAAQPFAFGGGDLGFYRDIANLDTGPGFWNGILSLVLNGQRPAGELADREQKATPYFHRAAAAELLRSFDVRFPQSPRRAGLHAQVIEASALHAEADRVARLGNEFLRLFPGTPERARVVLLTAGAHARLNQTAQEFALYDGLLDELAEKAGRVPIGENGAGQNAIVRSPDYTRILDRYIARLAATRQPSRALALYSREIERNPNDPGLYERLAGFLEQNKMAAELEATYRRALQQFNDKTWSHKLARYFVRQKMNAKMDELSRQVSATFSGLELEEFLRAGAEQGSLDPVLYRQVNLYAHQRFPHHLPFVKNLIAAHENRLTPNPAERDRLLRAYWMFDNGLRDRYFSALSASGRLDAEIAALEKETQPAQVRFVAEAEEWKGHFEKAAPLFRTLAADFPADPDLAGRAAGMYRSLAAWDPKNLDTAMELEEKLAQAHPSGSDIWTRLGEMQAERGRFDRAGSYWARIVANRPGAAEAYLETATLHWDYYRYDDALAKLDEGRKLLALPGLFAYEAGAIRENQGDLAGAAREYVAGAVTEGSESAAQRRLLRVAGRPAWRQPVAAALTQAGNPLALRVALIESRNDRPALEALLAETAGGSQGEVLTEIRNHARRNGLVNMERRVLEREQSLAAAPVEKMRILAERMRLEESARNPAAAERHVETLLRENPRSMGAVRTAVNFHARNGAKAKAAETLLAAAGAAYPELKRQFTLEAIRKFSEAGSYAAAHAEAGRLLAADPLDSSVLALKADAYARAKDDRSLAALYADAVKRPGQSAVQIAALRRNWIPALVKLNDHSGAADQFIELLKLYPEDTGLLGEAARHSRANGQSERLKGFFAKAERDSPRDARWPMVRARLEHEFGDYEQALAAWGRAVALRPERLDLLASRASLEERLGRFDLAAPSYRKLYEISYKNPDWLAQGARVLARQGNSAECVRWLREAWIENRPALANHQFQAAASLLDWGLVAQANTLYLEGAALATAESNLEYGAGLAARIAVLQRDFDAKVAQLERHVASGVRREFRANWIRVAARTAAEYLTPEEKLRFGAWLETQRALATVDGVAEAARTAGVNDSAVKIWHQAALAEPGSPQAAEWMANLERLQISRLRFTELGGQLEAYHRVFPNNGEKSALLYRARRAYFLGGSQAAELRVLSTLQPAGALGGDLANRYFELRSQSSPVTLTAAQRGDESFLDQFGNYALSAGRPAVFAQLTGGRRTAQWQNAARALAGLYFRENSPAVRKAFLDVVGPDRLGEKLALAGNRDAQVAGDAWFYYAGRYGAWLQTAADPAAAGYLAAAIEKRSNSASAYIEYGEEAAGAAARQAFESALLLDEHQPIAHARLAALARTPAERLAGWRRTFAELQWWQENRRVAEWHWAEATAAMDAAAGLRDELREPVDRFMRSYVKRNGAYRVGELLQALVHFAGDPARGVAWVADVARAAPDPAQFLGQIDENAPWLNAAGREALVRLRLEWSETQYQQLAGEEREFRRGQVDEARMRYLRLLASQNRLGAGAAVLDALAGSTEYQFRSELIEFRLRLAATANTLESVLDNMDGNPEVLRSVAGNLRRAGLVDAARTVARRSYQIELSAGNNDSALAGLADSYLESGEPLRALPLLSSYVMQAPIPFARHAEAAALLERHKQDTEAAKLLDALVKAEPWNYDAKMARKSLAAEELAANREAPYRVRAAAATAARKTINAGSAELNALGAGVSAATNVDFPLWTEARSAALGAGAGNAKLYRDILAADPGRHPAGVALFRLLADSGKWQEAAAIAEGAFDLTSSEPDRRRLAAVYRGTGQLERAIGFMNEWNDPAVRELSAQLERDRLNQTRRPILGPGLEQPHRVRPRLVAGGAR